MNATPVDPARELFQFVCDEGRRHDAEHVRNVIAFLERSTTFVALPVRDGIAFFILWISDERIFRFLDPLPSQIVETVQEYSEHILGLMNPPRIVLAHTRTGGAAE